MGITAFPFSSVIDVPTARILGRDDAGTGSAEALTNTEVFAILGTGTPSASTYLRGDGTWSTVSAGVGGSTGSVDNAVLRADGTGGATLQASAIVITDNFTSSPNATVNHASIQATGATTNVSVSVVPKGSGSFSLAAPDGTVAGGNARGANAVDLRTATRVSASDVASGARSFTGPNGRGATGVGAVALGGRLASGDGSASFGDPTDVSGNSATGLYATVICGWYSSATGNYSLAGGGSAGATGEYSVALGGDVVASGARSLATGSRAFANRFGMRAHGSTGFTNTTGECQTAEIGLAGRTTTNSAVSLRLDGVGGTNRLTIASGQICQYLLIITGVQQGGSQVATYTRKVCIKNIGGATSLVGNVETIGTDLAAGTSLSIVADDVNDSLDIQVTGVLNQNWRWQCVVYGGEIRHE